MSDAVTTAPGTPPIIRVEGVNKWYDSFQVLTDINLSVRPGERIVICGPSGSGKSTLIRCINRLETVQKGRIEVDGIDLTAEQIGKSGAAAFIGHMHDFNLCLTLEHLDREMLRRAIACGCKRDAAGAGLGKGHQFLDGFRLNTGIDHKYQRNGAYDRDVREALVDVKRSHRRRQCCIDGVACEGAHQQGVAIGRGTLDGARSDGARGTRAVFHDKGLAQLLAHAQGQGTRHGVGGAAGREGHDHGDRLVRISLCQRHAGQCGGKRQRGGSGKCAAAGQGVAGQVVSFVVKRSTKICT